MLNDTQSKILAGAALAFGVGTLAFYAVRFNARQPVLYGLLAASIRVFNSLNTIYGLFSLVIVAATVWHYRTRRKQ